MGVELGELMRSEKIKFDVLSGRKLAIDAYNSLYQFLSIIRQPDGTPLMDSKGRITSHLSGLLYRTANFVKAGILPVYVFDGKPPELKYKTLLGRKETKKQAMLKWDEAIEKGEEAKIYAQGTVKLSQEMVTQAKQLLTALNIPFVQAPSEGEAQASYMARKGDVWASVSQDFDSLLFNSPILIRNLAVTGRRKLPRKNVYITVEPEKIELDDNLKKLGITREQLIEIAIMVGNDYDKGIKGIGPKKALDLVKKGQTANDVFKEKNIKPDADLDEVRNLFMRPSVTNDYELKWDKPNNDAVLRLLVNEYDFSQSRVESALEKFHEYMDVSGTQSRLEQWF